MTGRSIRIFLKTVADLAGVNKLSAAVGALVLAVRAVRSAYDGLKSAGAAAMRGLGKGLDLAKKGALGVGVGLAGSVREFVVWNKEAARAWTMMDAGVAEFAALRKEISKLSPELGVAKSELGKGWYQALSAGVAQDQLIPFLRTAAKVAVADGSSIETAIDGITTVLNSYGMQSAQSAEVADLMFKTVAKGKTTFGELAAYISQVAPAASSMGVGLDQVLAAAVTLTKQGVPTATAMVQIRNAILGLNGELGDGWAASMTLQEGLEKVAAGAGYSANALEKAFGKENISGIMALIGKNAANAASDLAAMRAQGGGLAEAFAKVDSQVGHWPRVWQSLRALVSDVGEAVDTALRPAINYVSAKLKEMRESGGFSAFVERLGKGISDAAAKLIAGVQTAVDLLGKASLGGLLSGAVNALVDTAVTLLAEGLRSLGVVVVALAKIFSAALAADLMKMDVWGRDEEKNARRAAVANLKNLSPQQAAAFGVPAEFTEQDALMTPDQARERAGRMEAWSGGLGLDRAVEIATAGKDRDINLAIAAAFESFAASRGRMESLGGRVVGGLGQRTGVDIGGLYDANLGRVSQAFGTTPGAVPQAQPQAASAVPAQQAAAPKADTGAIRADADAASQALSDSTGLMREVFAQLRRDAEQQRAALKDLAARGKHPGG